MDKTGTLTVGKPTVEAVVTIAGIDESGLVRLAASLEQGSEHPLAAALVTAATANGIALDSVSEFQSKTGGGVTGKVGGKKVTVGNEEFLSGSGVSVSDLASRAEELRHQGQTVVFVAVDGRAAGVIGVADAVKPSTPQALRDLRAAGLRIVMLTGDSQSTAEAAARALGISEFQASVRPEQKAEVVQRLQKEGRIVAMAGDGINDAPALAQANVGIAMGTGTDVAMESGGVTLVKGDLTGILRARKLSQATMRNIRQNLFFAFIYNSIGVPIAAGVLYPLYDALVSRRLAFFLGSNLPTFAAAAMSLSSVSVIANSLRLRKLEL